ncbi:MAG: hypothetical protein RJQ07_06125 [Pseudomonadales bacterium]
MFELDQFIADCKSAVEAPEPPQRVKALVQQALTDPENLKAAITGKRTGNSLRDAVLYCSDELTILPATTPPGLRTPPHNHQMWAVIGVYEGIEPNDFYLDGNEGLEKKSSRVLETGDVAVLDGNTIHAISNPLDVPCYAIHVYGGNLIDREGRSMWNPQTWQREPYDIDQLSIYIQEMRESDTAA